MLDQAIRARLAPGLERAAARLGRLGCAPDAVTAVGLGIGVAGAAALALKLYVPALVLWLINRSLDGLDGPLARRGKANELGGLLDFTADFVVYSGWVVGVAVAHPDARLACVVLLASYLVNNVALLSFSSLSERLGLPAVDTRSLRLPPALAEGTETVVVYVLFCLAPGASAVIAWTFAAVVAITAGQRVLQARAALGAAGGRTGAGAQDRPATRTRDA